MIESTSLVAIAPASPGSTDDREAALLALNERAETVETPEAARQIMIEGKIAADLLQHAKEPFEHAQLAGKAAVVAARRLGRMLEKQSAKPEPNPRAPIALGPAEDTAIDSGPRRGAGHWTKERVVEAIREVGDGLGRTPSKAEMRSAGYVGATNACSRRGQLGRDGFTWRDAVTAAGYDPIDAGRPSVARGYWTKERVVEAIREVAGRNGRAPSETEMQDAGYAGAWYAVRKDGPLGREGFTWRAAVEAAGYTLNVPGALSHLVHRAPMISPRVALANELGIGRTLLHQLLKLARVPDPEYQRYIQEPHIIPSMGGALMACRLIDRSTTNTARTRRNAAKKPPTPANPSLDEAYSLIVKALGHLCAPAVRGGSGKRQTALQLAIEGLWVAEDALKPYRGGYVE